MLKMYDALARWWPLLSPPAEYEEEAAIYRTAIADACQRPPRTLVELGSGGGNNASHLKAHFSEIVLVDLSAGMLEISRALNPECEHVQGDMRSVRLGRRFDAVFVHDAVMYMTTESDLRLAMQTAFEHCHPGGAAVFAPDFVRETFEPSTEHGGSDNGAQGLRFLDWTWDPDPTDTTYVVDYAYLLRTADGAVQVEHDRHIEGLFSRADWLRLLTEVGFRATVVAFRHSEVERPLELFVGARW